MHIGRECKSLNRFLGRQKSNPLFCTGMNRLIGVLSSETCSFQDRGNPLTDKFVKYLCNYFFCISFNLTPFVFLFLFSFYERSVWTNCSGTLYELALQLHLLPKLPGPQDTEGSLYQLGVFSFPSLGSDQLLQVPYVFCLYNLSTKMWPPYKSADPTLQVLYYTSFNSWLTLSVILVFPNFLFPLKIPEILLWNSIAKGREPYFIRSLNAVHYMCVISIWSIQNKERNSSSIIFKMYILNRIE